jgi:hypothetical protein
MIENYNSRVIFFFFLIYRHPPAQEGIEWPEYYTINNHVIQHYYEFSKSLKLEGNFGYGLKTDECENLWYPYIYGFANSSNRIGSEFCFAFLIFLVIFLVL